MHFLIQITSKCLSRVKHRSRKAAYHRYYCELQRQQDLSLRTSLTTLEQYSLPILEERVPPSQETFSRIQCQATTQDTTQQFKQCNTSINSIGNLCAILSSERQFDFWNSTMWQTNCWMGSLPFQKIWITSPPSTMNYFKAMAFIW